MKNNFTRFLIIWFGELLSTIGSGLTAFALGIYAFKLTGQATSATMVTLFTFLPAFILRPIGGVLADRIDRRILMIFGNIGSALGIGLILFAMTYSKFQFWMIYPGIILSSIFYAFQNPAYKASLTDFLPKEMYAKASGLVQLSGSAQFLFSPIIAGFLFSIFSIKVILVIDIISFIISAFAIVAVLKTMKNYSKKENSEDGKFVSEMVEGFRAINKKGIMLLITIVSVVLFYTGLLQALFTPLVLSFTDSKTLGTAQSICAIGMLISSLIIGVFGVKKSQVTILSIFTGFMGVAFAFIGIVPNIIAVVIPGFLFFCAIPFVNSSIDVLIRQNIDNQKQGRVWALVSVVTYFGAMIAYAVSGILADKVFNPLLMPGGLLASSLGKIFGVGQGRGIALVFFLSGIFVIVLSLLIYNSKSIRELDKIDDSKEELDNKVSVQLN